MALYRLKVSGKQAKLGVVLVGDYAVTCEGIEVIVQPNQVLPHTHEIPKNWPFTIACEGLVKMFAYVYTLQNRVLILINRSVCN